MKDSGSVEFLMAILVFVGLTWTAVKLFDNAPVMRCPKVQPGERLSYAVEGKDTVTCVYARKEK